MLLFLHGSFSFWLSKTKARPHTHKITSEQLVRKVQLEWKTNRPCEHIYNCLSNSTVFTGTSLCCKCSVSLPFNQLIEIRVWHKLLIIPGLNCFTIWESRSHSHCSFSLEKANGERKSRRLYESLVFQNLKDSNETF